MPGAENQGPDAGLARWTSREGIKGLIARSDRVEWQQANLRVVIAGLVLLYLAWYVSKGGDNAPQSHLEALTVVVGYSGFRVCCSYAFSPLENHLFSADSSVWSSIMQSLLTA